MKKGATTAPRKRLGSPNASDASGTDTSRKKVKSKHPSSQPTPQPNSRPLSPAASTSIPVSSTNGTCTYNVVAEIVQAGKKRVRNVPSGGAGSTSDADGGAGSGGEMSENGKPKKLKLNPPPASSRGGTPQGSRAGSPTPTGSRGITGSRASSPEGGAPMRGEFHYAFPRKMTLTRRLCIDLLDTGQTQVSTPGPSGSHSFPTPTEIHAAIPQTGILSSDLLKIFRPRIGDSKENHRKFIAIVKDVGVYGKEDRLLRPGNLRET